jgi:hypothetical protein
MDVILSSDKRICAACDSTETYVYRNGREQWHIHDGYRLCQKCFDYYVHNPAWNKETSEKWNPINGPKHMFFISKIMILEERILKGICELCGNIKGKNCKKTDMHHIDYHEDDPTKDTIELCSSCHGKESRLQKKLRDNYL